jgi:hypothetical protein
MFDFQDKLKIKSLSIIHSLITAILILNFANVHADSIKLKETQTDKLKCKNYGEGKKKSLACDQFTSGKHSITVKLSAKTILQNGIDFQNIPADTLFRATIGDYQFSNSLSHADSTNQTTQKLEATWYKAHDEWIYNDSIDDNEKTIVRHSTVNIKASLSGATIKISGNRSIDKIEDNNFGDQVFLDLCKVDNGKSKKFATATISIGDANLDLPIKINCNVRKKQSIKKLDGIDETFYLENIGITGNLSPIVN